MDNEKRETPREVFPTKVDRNLEIRVIDWLQWSEFPENIMKRPDDADMAQITLILLHGYKTELKKYREKYGELT